MCVATAETAWTTVHGDAVCSDTERGHVVLAQREVAAQQQQRERSSARSSSRGVTP